jgi:hypothetical protein
MGQSLWHLGSQSPCLLPFLKRSFGEAKLTDARTESFLANLLALEGEFRDAIRKPLGCRSDVAVF